MGMPPFNEHDKIFDPVGTGSTGYLPFPLVVVIIGGHEPQWADELLARVNELDHEMLTVLTGFMIIVARDEIDVN